MRKAEITEVADHVVRGGVVVFPTETVYGIGARFDDAVTVERVFTAKARPHDRPLMVHVRDAGALDRLARDVPTWVWPLLESTWPGPLTVVVRARAEIPALVRGGGDTVGVRAPRHTLFAELVARVHALGGPPGLAGTSANLHGETPPTDAGAARACFPEHEIAVLDGGPCELGVESTVLLATGEHPKILRSGAYSQASLSELAGREVELASGIDALTRAPAITWRLADEHTLRTLVPDPHVGVLARLPAREGFGATWISLPEDHTAFARELYRAIARLEASGARQIFVHACGGTGIGAAIDERVRRRS